MTPGLWAGARDRLASAVRDAYGEAVRYIPAGGAPREIVARFAENFQLVDLNAGERDFMTPVSSSSPVLKLKLADLPVAPEQDDIVVTADGRRWRVFEVHPLPNGLALLILKKA